MLSLGQGRDRALETGRGVRVHKVTQEFEPRREVSMRCCSIIRAAAVGVVMWEPKAQGREWQARAQEAESGASWMPS